MEYTIMNNRDNNWKMDEPHMHDRIEILLSMTDGGSFLLVDKLHPIKKGMLVVMQEHALHKSIVGSSEYERYVLHFPRSTLYDAAWQRNDLANTYNRNCVFQLDESEFFELAVNMKRCISVSDEFGDEILRNCALGTILVTVARHIRSSDEDTVPVEMMSEAVSKAIDIIKSGISNELTLEKIAEKCYVTKYHLCRRFKKETGFTIGEYIVRLRILRAAELLREGFSVQRAGEEAGFLNYSNFIRTFGRVMGVPPGKYKKQNRH